MSAEETLYSTLAAAPSITAIVGDRVYPDIVPVSGLPAIAFVTPEAEYLVTIHDMLPVAVEPHVEIWCMGATRKAADELAEAVLPVVAPIGFRVIGRRPEIEEGPPLTYSAVLTVEAPLE
jgi:hypothetical protein